MHVCIGISVSRQKGFTAWQVCFEVVGYLLEELRDSSNLAAFTKDMQDANIFIGSLIFIEELAEKVLVSAGAQTGPIKALHCYASRSAASTPCLAWVFAIYLP